MNTIFFPVVRVFCRTHGRTGSAVVAEIAVLADGADAAAVLGRRLAAARRRGRRLALRAGPGRVGHLAGWDTYETSLRG